MERIIKVIFVLLCWLIASPVWAIAPTTFVWDRNTEIDMLEYRVYTCNSSATCIPNASIGIVPQPAIGTIPSFAIPAGSQGQAAVTAVDLVGNESGQSNIVSFDKQLPTNPLNLRTQ